jgi:hypothetical protein
MASLRIAAILSVLVASSCLNWSRFHGPADSGNAETCPPGAAPDFCTSIPALATTPTLDGVLECGVPLQRFSAADYYATNGPLPPGAAASFGVAWRPDGLYVYAQLEGAYDDPAAPMEGAYCGDSLEIFVDHDGVRSATYDMNGTRQLVIAAPPRGEAMGTLAQIFRDRMLVSSWPMTQWVSVRAGSLVRFEAFVIARDLGLSAWTPTASQSIGFDVSVTLGTGQMSDAGLCHHLLGHFILRLAAGDGGCSQPSCSPLAFCAPTLAP